MVPDATGPQDAGTPDAADPGDGAAVVDAVADGARDASADASAPTGVEPPFGASSGGTGGGAARGDAKTTGGGVRYNLIVPLGYVAGRPTPLVIAYSGTEGAAGMTSNMLMVADFVGLGDAIIAVLDGVDYRGDGTAGGTVIDHLRGLYDIDNDRTTLFSESAGTTAGLALGLQLRQSYFAAYWANDVNASGTPAMNAAAIGFAPWGNAGPGGDFPDANTIVAGMRDAGYRIEEPAPYDGPGAGTHGDTQQFIAGLQWLVGRSRR